MDEIYKRSNVVLAGLGDLPADKAISVLMTALGAFIHESPEPENLICTIIKAWRAGGVALDSATKGTMQ